MGRTTIRDIIKRNGDFKRFSIGFDMKKGRAFLVMEETPFAEKYSSSIVIDTNIKRLEELANDILNYLDKKVKWEEWKPTFVELERKLQELHGNDGVEMWFIDWVRFPNHKKEARRIYEWLKSNEGWLYQGE